MSDLQQLPRDDPAGPGDLRLGDLTAKCDEAVRLTGEAHLEQIAANSTRANADTAIVVLATAAEELEEECIATKAKLVAVEAELAMADESNSVLINALASTVNTTKAQQALELMQELTAINIDAADVLNKHDIFCEIPAQLPSVLSTPAKQIEPWLNTSAKRPRPIAVGHTGGKPVWTLDVEAQRAKLFESSSASE